MSFTESWNSIGIEKASRHFGLRVLKMSHGLDKKMSHGALDRRILEILIVVKAIHFLCTIIPKWIHYTGILRAAANGIVVNIGEHESNRLLKLASWHKQATW